MPPFLLLFLVLILLAASSVTGTTARAAAPDTPHPKPPVHPRTTWPPKTRLILIFSEEAGPRPSGRKEHPIFLAHEAGGYSLAGHRMASYRVIKGAAASSLGVIGFIDELRERVGGYLRGVDGSAVSSPYCLQLCQAAAAAAAAAKAAEGRAAPAAVAETSNSAGKTTARAFGGPICATMGRWATVPNGVRITHAYIFSQAATPPLQLPDCAQMPGVGGVASRRLKVVWVD